jgi:hypothetical protein
MTIAELCHNFLTFFKNGLKISIFFDKTNVMRLLTKSSKSGIITCSENERIRPFKLDFCDYFMSLRGGQNADACNDGMIAEIEHPSGDDSLWRAQIA